jgi:UDP-glucose 4-epimerase
MCDMQKKILLTGGTGYIGSHTAVDLLNAGYDVTIIDNLVNSQKDVVPQIEKITGKKCKFIKCDLLNVRALEDVFAAAAFDCVMHFAALKAVGESCEKPLLYYHNNVTGTINLLNAMQKYGVKKIIFSSSATVYGKPEKLPITEDMPLLASNPYGETKLTAEQMLAAITKTDKEFIAVALRYFNPIGADESGLIGEKPNGTPNNLAPLILQAACGKRDSVSVFGGDYNTQDGTGIRDYVHVTDVAHGHVLAYEKINKGGFYTYNLGTGKGVSVLQLIRAFEKASGKKINYKIVSRRAGDIDSCYADCSKAKKDLGYSSKFGIDEMCSSMWKFVNNGVRRRNNGKI